MLYSLKQGILYGPVSSRRLGYSLGINLMSWTYKLCSFNCIYCHFGWTDKLTLDVEKHAKDFPAFEDVVKAIEEAVQSEMGFDYMTFSGNGEPTLYPQFPELVDAVVQIRDTYRPSVKLALLSNSTGLGDERVRASIPKIDIPLFKLDAGNEKTFKAINRPARGIKYDTIVEQLTALNNIYIQTAFLGGSPTNETEEELRMYFEKIRQIKPREVHIYSIDRPVPHTEITLVLPERLEEIARRGEQETGVRFKAFYQAQVRMRQHR
jgi:wyosine [tRNA(Phe)-imidazoG37] synthetase (radical SAM superfamily)